MSDDPQLSITQEQIASLSPESRATLSKNLGAFSSEQKQKIGLGGDPIIPPLKPADQPKMSVQEANVELRLNLPRMQEAGSPSDYSIRLDNSTVQELGTEKAQELRTFYQTALSAGAVPKSSSQAIVRETLAAAAKIKSMSVQERTKFLASEQATLDRLSTGKMVRENFAFAFNRMPADFQAAAEKNGYFATASSVIAFAAAGELMIRRTTR